MTYAGSEKFYKLGYNAALNDIEQMILHIVCEQYGKSEVYLLLKLFDQIDSTIKQNRENDNDRRNK